ncbi:hypothetical protein RpY1_027 [Ralstonia phage RpY1]|nr:hypothetical protein RpY1_027 [Ralstonia phage RpY1]
MVGFEDRYEVSDEGEVFSLRLQRRLVAKQTKRGYFQVHLRDSVGKEFSRSVHVLVAEAFIGPRADGVQVNHIDHNKANNRLSNLEYVTGVENVHAYHRHKNPHWEPKKPSAPAPRGPKPMAIVAIGADGTERVFVTVKAAIDAGFTASGISSCLKGRLHAHRGHTFRRAG